MACKVVRKIQRENEAATLSKLMQKKATKEQVVQKGILTILLPLSRLKGGGVQKKPGSVEEN